MNEKLSRGFLPPQDPATAFPPGSPFELLDQVGRDLPSLLLEDDARQYLQSFVFPDWDCGDQLSTPLQHLYYVRLGFIASGYINQIGTSPCHQLPKNLAQPLCSICHQLQRPPILSYDGYALYNWKRFDKKKPVQLGNIDTLQNFVHLYDEHWFILVHVDIEMKAAETVSAIQRIIDTIEDTDAINKNLKIIAGSLAQQVSVLKRIPERMSPDLYFKAFRPYIRFFEQVTYEGVQHQATNFRGETGAQSSIMPSLVALLKIPHQASELTNHLRDMRNYMPVEHQQLLTRIEKLPPIKPLSEVTLFNEVLEQIAQFREIHFNWAQQYINAHVQDPRGTGGTPYMRWLKQLIDETRGFMIH
ncbi:hypothetical protein R50073_29330 [Maricurvus nonylphenolicus]|uniref:hypothetical protein n=1 Tax=Maricurvus nonylphenolicus TaxID=1008307 RepID=UPI0036F21507